MKLHESTRRIGVSLPDQPLYTDLVHCTIVTRSLRSGVQLASRDAKERSPDQLEPNNCVLGRQNERSFALRASSTHYCTALSSDQAQGLCPILDGSDRHRRPPGKGPPTGRSCASSHATRGSCPADSTAYSSPYNDFDARTNLSGRVHEAMPRPPPVRLLHAPAGCHLRTQRGLCDEPRNISTIWRSHRRVGGFNVAANAADGCGLSLSPCRMWSWARGASERCPSHALPPAKSRRNHASRASRHPPCGDKYVPSGACLKGSVHGCSV